MNIDNLQRASALINALVENVNHQQELIDSIRKDIDEYVAFIQGQVAEHREKEETDVA